MATKIKLHTNPISYLTLIAISLIYMPQTFLLTEAVGFSVDLIHRNSLQSPSLNYSSHQSVTNSLRRSFHRHRTLTHHSPRLASAEIIPNRGEYLMKFSLGTPPVETLAIADTGSDLTWIQCKPCRNCFKQKSPLYVPASSSTYKSVSCSSDACNSLPRGHCGAGDICRYEIHYGDNSFSRGELATETITLGSTTKEKVTIPSVTIGCGHVDQGTFGGATSGIVGLGGGDVSLITQMGPSIQGKFSYCLIPFFGVTPSSKRSKLSFGDEAIVSGTGADVVTTPIVTKSPKTFYYLTLEGITVGDQRLDLDQSSPSSSSSDDDEYGDDDDFTEGNIIIDSGTTLTFLPEELFDQVITAVKSQVNLERTFDPQGLLKLCYRSSGNTAEDVPEFTVHFKGADVRLKSVNTFVKTSEDSLCLAFAPASTLAIYGNLAQMNFLVGYDLEKKTVSFKPTDCSTNA